MIFYTIYLRGAVLVQKGLRVKRIRMQINQKKIETNQQKPWVTQWNIADLEAANNCLSEKGRYYPIMNLLLFWPGRN